eukprot:12898419-Prorocentrum_lima.AAC.1
MIKSHRSKVSFAEKACGTADAGVRVGGRGAGDEGRGEARGDPQLVGKQLKRKRWPGPGVVRQLHVRRD